MRILMYAAPLLILGSCKTPPLMEADYSTPRATLLTFHNAFQNDRADREYECFSHEFKENRGGFGLSNYYDFRQILLDEHPVAAYVFSLNDLSDNIEEEIVSGDRATLFLSVYGQEISIDLIRTTTYRIEFEGDELRAEEDILDRPLHELIRLNEEEYEFYLTLPLGPRTQENLRTIRKIAVDKHWKFLDFPFLDENVDLSN